MRIAFVGCGSAGRPLGVAWARAGHEIGAVVCRTSAADAVAVLGQGTPGGDLTDADVVVFATPDDVLAAAAKEHTLRAEQVALHLSGAHASTILAPTGARTASLHPLRAAVRHCRRSAGNRSLTAAPAAMTARDRTDAHASIAARRSVTANRPIHQFADHAETTGRRCNSIR